MVASSFRHHCVYIFTLHMGDDVKHLLKGYISFSRKEKWAVLSLVILTVLAWMIPFIIPGHPEPPVVAYEEWRSAPRPAQEEKRFGADGEQLEDNSQRPDSWSGAPKQQATLFYFDPNTIGAEEWVSLGLPRHTAGTIIKYREKGGRFSHSDDLSRIYGIQKADLARLKPFVRIHAASHSNHANTDSPSILWQRRGEKRNERAAPRQIDINKADSLSWLDLPGIGPYWASRILRYRSRLGGFTHVGQVAEVYRFPDSVFRQISGYLKTDSMQVEPWLDLNNATVQELAAHPYIDLRLAKMLIAYRRQHGAFKTWEEVARVALAEPLVMEKIKPYIRVSGNNR